MTSSLNQIFKKELFCETYWRMMKERNLPVQRSSRFDFADANDILMEKFYTTETESKSLIKNNDIVMFQQAYPLKKELVLWRGISEPSDKIPYLKNKFQKCINLKEGDVLYMPEYAFFSDHYDIAKKYSLVSNEGIGIQYEVTFPIGSKIHKNLHYITKRCSKFICTANNMIKKGKSTIYNIKLTMLHKI